MSAPHHSHGTRREPPTRRPDTSALFGQRTLLVGTAALVPVGAVTLWHGSAAAAAVKATLYKNPQCSCCEAYASYLGQHGFDVTVIPSNDLVSLNRQHGVPEALDGCHTILMSGYVVIGHVPADSVQRLLTTKPAVTGISIPGMPSGTPGMGGPKEGHITVYAFGQGKQSVFATF